MQNRQSAGVEVSAYENYDDNLTRQGAGASTSGFYSHAESTWFYARRSRRAEFGSHAGATVDYYPALRRSGGSTLESYYGNANISIPAGRTRVRAEQTVGYQPYFQFLAYQLMPLYSAARPFTPSDFQTTSEFQRFPKPATTYSTMASWYGPLSRRSSFETRYTLQAVNGFTGGWTDQTTQSASGSLRRAVGRRSTIHGQYTYGSSRYGLASVGNNQVNTHDVDIGVEYVRPLSPTRSMSITLGGGESFVRNQLVFDPENTYQHRQLAYAAAEYGFARYWSIRGDFRRTLQFIAGLRQPFYGSAGSAMLQGALGRRVEVFATGSFADAETASRISQGRYTTRLGSIGARYGLSRSLAMTVQFVHSEYSIGQNIPLPPNTPADLRRNLVRVGLTYGRLLLREPQRP